MMEPVTISALVERFCNASIIFGGLALAGIVCVALYCYAEKTKGI